MIGLQCVNVAQHSIHTVASENIRRKEEEMSVLSDVVTLCSSGGYNREECLRTVECYDLKTDSWSFIAPMRTPRARFQMAVLMVQNCTSCQNK